MIKQSIQVLFNKFGYHICKNTAIEALRNENEKLKIYYENSYGKYWDHYVSEDFNNIIKKRKR